MAPHDDEFDRSVFINCPFDETYRPILEAILFCVIDCGLVPRIASERLDSGETRLAKIVELIRASRYSIHDLSRAQAHEAGELARLNMPFELGVDWGIATEAEGRLRSKQFLVIAKDRYVYQAALSDIAGWDIRSHGEDFETAIGEVRGWIASKELTTRAASQVVGDYLGYQEWDYERLLDKGWEDSDIQGRPTAELLRAMTRWVRAGRPMTY